MKGETKRRTGSRAKDRSVMMGVLGSLPPMASNAEIAEALLAKFTLANPGQYHGTYARWQIEYHAGIEPCGPCKEAKARYQRDARERKTAEKKREEAAREEEPEEVQDGRDET